jgi:hypothetical protein
MKKLLLWALGAAFVCRIVSAQDTDSDFSSVPPPKAPFVARTPQKSAWTIDFTSSQNDPAPTPAPAPGSPAPTPAKKPWKQQAWTKSGTLMRCVKTWPDGSTTEDWVVGAVMLSQHANEKGIHLFNPKTDVRYHDFGVSDFEMLDWITAKDYDKVVKHGGEVCYRFTARNVTSARGEDGPHPKTLAQLNAPITATTVYISVQSGLPVELDNGDGKYLYHYLPTPTDELKLPEPFLTFWRALRQH